MGLDSRAEAEVATGTVTQHKEGRQLRDWLKGNYRAMVEPLSGYSIFSCVCVFLKPISIPLVFKNMVKPQR